MNGNPQFMLDRRGLLSGFSGLALSQMFARDAVGSFTKPELNGGVHHPAKVKRVIQLFMNGGASPMDTWDYKPDADEARWSEARLEGRRSKARPRHAGSADEEPVRVQAARSKRTLGEQRLSRAGKARRRDGLPHGDAGSLERAWPERLHDEQRLPAARLSLHGRVDFVCAGQSHRQPAHLHRAAGCAGLPYNGAAVSPPAFLPAVHQGTVINAGASQPIPDLFASDKFSLRHASGRWRRPRAAEPR
jgi:hypothetical protein